MTESKSAGTANKTRKRASRHSPSDNNTMAHIESLPRHRANAPTMRGEVHPLLKDAAALPTRPLEHFVNIILMWLENLLPGGVVWGHPRTGKSHAIRFFISNVHALLGNPIPATLLSISEAEVASNTENRFFGAILSALGYSAPLSGTAAVKRQRVIGLMTDRVLSAQEHRHLLFVDEAQLLAINQFRYLMDLHNQLKAQDIRLITVLVGQPELVEVKARLKSDGHTQLLGRFMTDTHRFEGVVDQSDFVRFCRSFDIDSEWPAGSGNSFTRYFVPIGWMAGWRLESHAVEIWDVISSFRRLDDLPEHGELPMQAMTALLRWLLKTLQRSDASDLVLERSTIEEAYERVARIQIKDFFDSQTR